MTTRFHFNGEGRKPLAVGLKKGGIDVLDGKTFMTLVRLEIALKNALTECENLPCRCDSYNGFTCPIHGWKRSLEQIITQIDNAIEAGE